MQRAAKVLDSGVLELVEAMQTGMVKVFRRGSPR